MHIWQENWFIHAHSKSTKMFVGEQNLIPRSSLTMLKAVELPASLANLHAGLADVDRNDLAHGCGFVLKEWKGEGCRG